jgi:hypothetical protein
MSTVSDSLTTTTTTAPVIPVVKHSTGSAKSQFDAAVSILAVLGEIETATYWTSTA